MRASSLSTQAEGEARLEVSLHPAARPLVLTATDAGRVAAEADTAALGPGYHRLVGRLLERMEQDLAVDWGRVNPDNPDEVDEAATLTFADRAVSERAYLTWLGRTLSTPGPREPVGAPRPHRHARWRALHRRRRDRDLPRSARRRVARTRDWRPPAGHRRDPVVGRRDRRPSFLTRALTLMWFEVRWRPPALKPEGLVLDEVHRLLSRAFPLDPSLSYPWRAWAEIVGLRGHNDPMARQVVARAMREAHDGVEIGYRRAPVTITHEGWALTVPGSFAEKRSAEEWWGGGTGRAITLAAVQTGTDSGSMGAQAFVNQFAGDIGPDAIDHHGNGVVGRARLSTDTSSGVEIGVLDGYSAVIGSGAAIRIEFDDPADWQWALEMWKSLAPG